MFCVFWGFFFQAQQWIFPSSFCISCCFWNFCGGCLTMVPVHASGFLRTFSDCKGMLGLWWHGAQTQSPRALAPRGDLQHMRSRWINALASFPLGGTVLRCVPQPPRACSAGLNSPRAQLYCSLRLLALPFLPSCSLHRSLSVFQNKLIAPKFLSQSLQWRTQTKTISILSPQSSGNQIWD